MTGATLDTSGSVDLRNTVQPHTWSDLDAFTQGYVEALFSGPISVGPDAHTYNSVLGLGFSDLAPETLALILRDCARFLALGLGENDREHGRRFWLMRVCRQVGGGWRPNFPPLTAYLGDDGKVYLRAYMRPLVAT